MSYRNNLDPLRGLAAAAVVAHHFQAHAGLSAPWISDVGGLLGVQMFFVLSGYLIAASAARHDWRTYLVRAPRATTGAPTSSGARSASIPPTGRRWSALACWSAAFRTGRRRPTGPTGC